MKGVMYILPEARGINANSLKREVFNSALTPVPGPNGSINSIDFWLDKAGNKSPLAIHEEPFLCSNLIRLYFDLSRERNPNDCSKSASNFSDPDSLLTLIRRGGDFGMRTGVVIRNYNVRYDQIVCAQQELRSLLTSLHRSDILPLVAYISIDNEMNNHNQQKQQCSKLSVAGLTDGTGPEVDHDGRPVDCFDTDVSDPALPAEAKAECANHQLYIDNQIEWAAFLYENLRQIERLNDNDPFNNLPRILLTVGMSSEMGSIDGLSSNANFYKQATGIVRPIRRKLDDYVDFFSVHRYVIHDDLLIDELRHGNGPRIPPTNKPIVLEG